MSKRKQNPVCPRCTGWMQEYSKYPGWLRCSCGYAVKIDKRIVKPVKGEK